MKLSLYDRGIVHRDISWSTFIYNLAKQWFTLSLWPGMYL